MSETLVRTSPTRPECAEVVLVRVVDAQRISEGFVRVTVVGHDGALDATFAAMGYDQWVRLFLPIRREDLPVVPYGDIDGWYTRWLELPEGERATIRNYTIRQARHLGGRWEIDIDFVVHTSASGRVDGVGAQWALDARPGDVIGMLDQGTIFDATGVDPTASVVVLADETGIPAAEGIAAALPAGQRALFLLEIAADHDRRVLPGTADLEVQWCVRGDQPSGSALALAMRDIVLSSQDYVYVVGESAAVLELRAMARAAGVPKDRVDFCAYWRQGRRADAT